MKITNINLSEILRNEDQPRKHFDEQAIVELSESIKKDGLMQPITVRKVSRDTNEYFEIVQGERRFRACKLVGLTEIPAFIQDLSDEDAFHLSVIENIQREQMTPIEEAQAFQKYVEMGYKHDQIAEKVSKSRDYVSGKLRLLKLITRIQDWIADKKLSDGHAKQILRMESIINRFWEGKPVYSGSHFNFFQERFVDAFWDRLDGEGKLSVNEVKEWGDDWHYRFINSTILHFLGHGDTVIGNRGFSLTAEIDCNLYHLHISKITEEDIKFANKLDRKIKDEYFDDKLRPWMIDKFWDDIKMKLFHSDVDPSELWKNPLQDTSLEETTKRIREQQDRIEATLFLFAEMFHKFADEEGRKRLSNRDLADRFLKSNEYSIHSIEELEELFEQVQEKTFQDDLLTELRDEIEKSVT